MDTLPENKHDNGKAIINEDVSPIENGDFPVKHGDFPAGHVNFPMDISSNNS